MKKEIIFVPRDHLKSNLVNVMNEMGDAITNSWIFFHKDLIQKIQAGADRRLYCNSVRIKFEEGPIKTILRKAECDVWYPIYQITGDVDYREVVDPDEIFFFQLKD